MLKRRENMIKGRRLTNKESTQMLDNEIFQTEERTDKLVKELDDIKIIGVDISHTTDQSSMIYVSSKGRIIDGRI
jgi:bacterioferritin (cytochrome b1)